MNRDDDINRAAQFLPFDALKGLSEEIQCRIERRTRIERKEISEDKKEEISTVLCKLDKGMTIKVTFYSNGHYIEVENIFDKINYPYHYLVVGGNKIFFDDIYDISIILP